ncbi:MAG: site-specific DNA-methyltransferase [Firmicutes bacterium]|nr:site-specific DNA-methyltransferase [Bacillota bacterium]
MDLNLPIKNIYFGDNEFHLLLGDSLSILRKIKPKSVDMIFADPPYFLSNGGISVHSGKMVTVDKADWDKGMITENKLKYSRRWIRMCREVLQDNGTIWISGTFHNIYFIGVALELEGFNIINNITWRKLNPPPNISTRAFTHSTEMVLWARKQLTSKKKGNHQFNYQDMKVINGGKQMKDVWDFALTKASEKRFGKHPTQKPFDLLERIVLASTKVNDMVLDPFCGSGTTGLAAYKHGRRFVGIDAEESYLELCKKRYIGLKGGKNNE